MATLLEILINARNRAGPAFTQLQGQLAGVDNAARVAGGGLNAMLGIFAGGAAIVGIASAVRELQTLGIQSANTEQAFRGLADSAGESADVMLGKLRDASRGMITDLDLMTNANRAMMLGVTTSADEMAGLLQVAATRGRALGRSTAEAFTDIVTGIGRMSPLILDNLGIVTGGEKAFEDYAKTLNTTADKLSDVERKQFLVNKVLGETPTQTKAAVDSIATVGVAWQNYKAALGVALGSDSAIGGALARYLQFEADLQNINNRISQSLESIDIGWVEQARIQMGMVVGPTATFYQKLQDVRTQFEAHKITAPQAAAAITALTRVYSGAAVAAGALSGAVGGLNSALRTTGTITVAEVQTAFPRLGSAAGGLSDTLRETTAATKQVDVAFHQAGIGASTYNSELEKLKSSIESIISSSVSGTKSLVDFSGATGGFDPNGPARDFGRMWDVAVNGFQSQWLDELRAQGLIPDDVLAAGEAALKQFAEGKAKAFQAGTDLGLLDVGAVTAQVQQQIAANAEMERMKASILATLTGQGINRSDATRALGQVLGDGTSAGVDVGTGIATGIPQGLDTAGGKIAAALKQSINDSYDLIKKAGEIIGRGLGDGLLQVFKDNVPAELVGILADLVAPEVLKRLNASKTTTGARP